MAVETLIEALKANYDMMRNEGDVTSLRAYEVAIEPLVADLTPEQRRELGQTFWQEFYETHDKQPGDIYLYTGLAVHLDPPAGGS